MHEPNLTSQHLTQGQLIWLIRNANLPIDRWTHVGGRYRFLESIPLRIRITKTIDALGGFFTVSVW